MAAYVYSQALKSCGKDGDIVDTPAKIMPQKFESLFQECVRSELRNYMKEGYAYATSVTTHPERHSTLKNATDIRVQTWTVEQKLDFLPVMIKEILNELNREYSDRVEDDQDIYYAEIAKVMNYYAAAKNWIMENGIISQFIDADEDLFAVPREYGVASISSLLDQQKRIMESARVEDLPRIRKLQELVGPLQEVSDKLEQKLRARDDENREEYPDNDRMQFLNTEIQELEAQKEELTEKIEELYSQTGINPDTLRQIQLRRHIIPESVKIIAQIGGLTSETMSILRKIIIEENWRELNHNIDKLGSEMVFKEYSRHQWESYPDRNNQDFEDVFRRETRMMPQDILEVAIARAVELYNNEKLDSRLTRKIAIQLKLFTKVDPENRERKRADITAELEQLKSEYNNKPPNILEVQPLNGEFSCTDFRFNIEGRDDETGQYDGPYQYALVMMAAKYQGKGGKQSKRRMDRSRQERIARRIILDGAILNKNMDTTTQKRVSFSKMLEIYESVRKNDLTKTLVEPLTQGYLRLIEQNFRQEYQSIVKTDPVTAKRTVERVPVMSRSKQLRHVGETLSRLPTQRTRGTRKTKTRKIIRAPADRYGSRATRRQMTDYLDFISGKRSEGPFNRSRPVSETSTPQSRFTLPRLRSESGGSANSSPDRSPVYSPGRSPLSYAVSPAFAPGSPTFAPGLVTVGDFTIPERDLLVWRDWVETIRNAPAGAGDIMGPEGIAINEERATQIIQIVDQALEQRLISTRAESPAFAPVSPAFAPASPAFGAGSDTEQERLASLSRRDLLIAQAYQEQDFQEEFIKFLNECPGSEPEDFKLSRSDRYTEDLYPIYARDIPLLFGKTLIVPSILSSICRWFNDELNKADPTRKLKRRSKKTPINPEMIRRLAIDLADRHPPVVKSLKARLEKADNFIKRRLLEVYKTISAIVDECCNKYQVTSENIYHLLFFIYSRCNVVENISLVDKRLKPLSKTMDKSVFRPTPDNEMNLEIRNFLTSYVTNLFLGVLNAENARIFVPKTQLPRNPEQQQERMRNIEQKTAEDMLNILESVENLPLNDDFLNNPEERIKKLKKIVNGSFNPQNPDEKYQILRRWEFFQDSAKFVEEYEP